MESQKGIHLKVYVQRLHRGQLSTEAAGESENVNYFSP